MFVETDVHDRNGCISYPAGSKILVKSIKYEVGGGGTNSAVGFSRLGLKTGYIGNVGDKRVFDLLKKENIKFLGNKVKDCDMSIILDSLEHSRTVLTYKEINNKLKFNQIKKFKSKWLYFSTMLGDSFKSQIKLAKKFERVAFNPSEYLIKKHNIKPLLKFIDVLILNKEEAKLLVKGDLLKELNKLGPAIIVITDRNKEILCYDGNRKYKVIPHKLKVVERTGAGDAFASGFVAGLVRGISVENSLQIGLQNSESVIRYFGPKNKLLRWKDVNRKFKKL